MALFGELRCDLVIGDVQQNAYTFVELEDAKPNSFFAKHGKELTSECIRRFERGYSQIIDWFCKIQAMTNTPDMETRFGKRSINYIGLVVVGRDQYLDAGERLRLEWRRKHVVVNSKQIRRVTNDELIANLDFRLSMYEKCN